MCAAPLLSGGGDFKTGTMKLVFFEKNEIAWAFGILEINARSLIGWQYSTDYGHALELFWLVIRLSVR